MISIYRIKILFILFMFYSLIGWIIEVFDQLYRQKKFINRGFLIGPYCPVHGVGALLMLLLLKRFSNNILLLFMISILICTILEYLTSFLLEKFFKARWWDYSDYKFNLNGRVCLQNSLFFGLAGVTIVKFANPMLMNLLISIEPNIINIIFFTLFIIFAIDLLISFKVIFLGIKKYIANPKIIITINKIIKFFLFFITFFIISPLQQLNKKTLPLL